MSKTDMYNKFSDWLEQNSEKGSDKEQLRDTVKIIREFGYGNLGVYVDVMEKSQKRKSDGRMYFKIIGLFDEKFISKYTSFEFIEELFVKSPFQVETDEDYERIKGEEFDNFIQDETMFFNWEHMVYQAWKEVLTEDSFCNFTI